MMDWADEIAASLVQENSTEGYDGSLYFDKSISVGDCAKALRKAKADGVRFAADQWENPIYEDFKKGLRTMAAAIEE